MVGQISFAGLVEIIISFEAALIQFWSRCLGLLIKPICSWALK
jgi:hypothetical protein